MNMHDLDITLQEELSEEIHLPPGLDTLVQQKMKVVVQKRSKRWLVVPAIASIVLAVVEMSVALSFIHSLELKLMLVGVYISLISILIFYAIISSDHTNKKELHYV